MSAFVQYLAKFKMELESQYGVHDGLTKVALHPKLYDIVFTELACEGTQFGGATFWYQPRILGIEIVPRVIKEDTF